LNGAALAQGTGSVASPTVRPGASFGLASGVAFDDAGDGVALRIDYRRAVSENVRVGAIMIANDRGGEFRYRHLELETLYQFASGDLGWSSAVQFRGRIPDGNDGPGRVRAAWLNRWRPAENIELRLMGIVHREFGDGREDGIGLETRGEVTWRIASGMRLGAQTFNRYNTTANFGALSAQRHAIGAVAKGALTDKVSYRINALAGLTGPSSDFELRARLQLAM